MEGTHIAVLPYIGTSFKWVVLDMRIDFLLGGAGRSSSLVSEGRREEGSLIVTASFSIYCLVFSEITRPYFARSIIRLKQFSEAISKESLQSHVEPESSCPEVCIAFQDQHIFVPALRHERLTKALLCFVVVEVVEVERYSQCGCEDTGMMLDKSETVTIRFDFVSILALLIS
ncbi:hypothetical protein Tco_0167272 [Tanacetum coccineum]